jgi:hypothetical protein
MTRVLLALGVSAVLIAPSPLAAQEHQHTPGMHGTPVDSGKAAPPAGQAAFASIADVVRQLEADPATDWSRVNIEKLRQHLIDMDEVIMRSRVEAAPVAGGARFTVRGAPRTAAAIQRMLEGHTAMLKSESGLVAVFKSLPDGAVFTVTAGSPQDAKAFARIRGLGFAGLLTVGEHHAAHHLALARGEAMSGHHRP